MQVASDGWQGLGHSFRGRHTARCFCHGVHRQATSKDLFGMCLKGRMLVLKDMMGNLASSFGCQGKFAVIYHQIA